MAVLSPETAIQPSFCFKKTTINTSQRFGAKTQLTFLVRLKEILQKLVSHSSHNGFRVKLNTVNG